MVVILRNEVLGECGDKVIYKTSDSETDRYVLYRVTPEGVTSLDENYIHKFPFKGKKTPAITRDEEYVWISSNLEENPMAIDEVYDWLRRVPNTTSLTKLRVVFSQECIIEVNNGVVTLCGFPKISQKCSNIGCSE
jgi:hypothetical protein